VNKVDRHDLLKLAADPKYVKGIYNYCDRWCERCPFTSRCLNCELVERKFGDLEEKDGLNEAFWQRFSEMLHETLELVCETARERGIDLDAIEADEDGWGEWDDEKNPAVHLIVHASLIHSRPFRRAPSIENIMHAGLNLYPGIMAVIPLA
jgi:hypothetical protein